MVGTAVGRLVGALVGLVVGALVTFSNGAKAINILSSVGIMLKSPGKFISFGRWLGEIVGVSVGDLVGTALGRLVGALVGLVVGSLVAFSNGSKDIDMISSVGIMLKRPEKSFSFVGESVGDLVGTALGRLVGALMGPVVGALVSFSCGAKDIDTLSPLGIMFKKKNSFSGNCLCLCAPPSLFVSPLMRLLRRRRRKRGFSSALCSSEAKPAWM
jgi:tetrahydromethanopterin S-methyltransferase subunit G